MEKLNNPKSEPREWPQTFINWDFDEAEKYISKSKWYFEIAEDDGYPMLQIPKFRPYRISVFLKKNIIINALLDKDMEF